MTKFLIKMFVKDYEKTSDFVVKERYGTVATIVGIISNMVLFVTKIIIGTITKSMSITADAVNNLSDSSSSLITLLGFKIAGKPADEKHPFGHARMENISGLIVSLAIIFIGLQLIQNSIDKIIHPELLDFSIVSVVILVIAIFIKLWQFVFYRNISKKIDSLSLYATSIDSRNDIIVTSGVLLGLIFSFITGFNLDAYIGGGVSIFIIISGVKLVMQTVNPLLGTAPSKEFVDDIYKKILGYEHVIGLHNLNVHYYGMNRCYASVHCELPAEQDVMVSHEIIDKIERDFLENEGINLVIHLDPLITNNKKTNELRNKLVALLKDISPRIDIHDFRMIKEKKHKKVVFDIVVPFDLKNKNEEIIEYIIGEIAKIDANYYPVVTVIRGYVPGNGEV